MPIRKNNSHRGRTPYLRKDQWIDIDNAPLPEFCVLDVENVSTRPYACNNAEHACAVASSMNRKHYVNQPGNWTKYVACYKSRDSFRMLEFEHHLPC